uniref:alpha-(1,6)-fucosyltransferase-like n=1 Tax=Ciona intestinalis TaxID=7719 RepID=UPI000EF468D6
MLTAMSRNLTTVVGVDHRGFFGEQSYRKLRQIILPVSDVCPTVTLGEDLKKIEKPSFEYSMTSLPPEVTQTVNRLHSNPMTWWVGQVTSYLMTLQPDMRREVDRSIEQHFSDVIVGIHVRRSDKVNRESQFYDADEYMRHVEKWYQRRDIDIRLGKGESPIHGSSETRKVFVATDDVTVIDEMIQRYPHYVIIHDRESAAMGNDKLLRHTAGGIQYVTMDIMRLVECDYVICTMTSNICRLTFELMQQRYGDVTNRLLSLDRSYNFHRRKFPTNHIVVLPHTGATSSELTLSVGDRVDPLHRKWKDDLCLGVKRSTGGERYYPDHV